MDLRQAVTGLIIDGWSWLNYKPTFSADYGQPSRRVFPEAFSTWVPDHDFRRLAAYKLLAAYDNNQAGELASITGDDEDRDRREFGDPSQIIDTLVAHVLGREQHIIVPGAENADTSPDPDPGPDPAAQTAARVQDQLRTWAENELLPMRLQQGERKAVGLGDGVYLLAWDPGKRRVTVRVYDPGLYFPISDDDDNGEFPRRVHFAWELPENPAKGLKRRLRRITYELDWIRPATGNGLDDNGRPVRAPLPGPEPDSDDTEPAGPVLVDNDTLDPATGAISRDYPWNDGPSYITCYLTDATWNLGDLKGPDLDIDTLPLETATFATNPQGEVLDHLDLMIDFIPVIHVPNTVPAAGELWGQPSLAKILQVLDELQGVDTDSSKASATTGSPMVAFSGEAIPTQKQTLEVGPGVAHNLGVGGRMDILNTAPQLAELRNKTQELRDRASTVARIPAVALGTVDPSKVPSGYALQLSYGPMDSLIDGMRLARAHKDALLLKLVQRLHQAGGHPDWAGLPVLPAKLVRGPYTPTDKQAVLEQVTKGVEAGVLSLETAVRMLDEAGFPIDDATEEIKRIQSRQFDKARLLADALGDPAVVRDYLGLAAPTTDPPPPPVLPPPPGTAPTRENTDPGQSGGNPR